MRPLFLVLTVFGLLARPAATSAQTEQNAGQWEITVECWMVTVPQKAVLTLVPELMDETTIESGWAKLQALIEKSDAKLEANLIARTPSGTPLATESVQEVRYPVDFSAPELPEKTPHESKEDLDKHPLIAFAPTAFEKRNVGPRMQLDLVERTNNGEIRIRAVIEHSRLLGWKKLELGSLPDKRGIFIELPEFAAARSFNEVQLRNNQRLLFGIHKLDQTADAFELFLIKASTKLRP